MGYVQFMAAFLLLVGTALLMAGPGRMAAGEGMTVAVALAMVVVYISASAGYLQTGFGVIRILGAAGWLLYLIRKRKTKESLSGTSYLMVCLLALLFFMAAYRGDFIQRIDELHLWAPVVRSILRTGSLQMPEGLYVGNQLLGTSMLHVFALQFTGFHEAFLYVSGTMLIFMGALLPFGSQGGRCADRKNRHEEWAKILIYTLLIWLALYSCYYYGAKTLYVDMATAAWSGGLAAWWVCREKNSRRNVPVFVCGMMIVFFMKIFVGLVMDILLILWAVSWTYFVEGRYERMDSSRQRRFKAAVFSVLLLGLAAGAAMLLISPLRQMLFARIGIVDVTEQKIKQTLVRFVTVVFGRSLSASGRIGIAFLPGIAVTGLLISAAADLRGNTKQRKVTLCYVMLAVAIYLIFLLTAFALLFSYEEAVALAGIGRYLSIPLMYLLIIAVTLLLREWTRGEGKTGVIAKYAVLLLMGLFALNINEGFIPSMTGIDKPHISGYKDIHETKEEIRQIRQLIGPEDRVYLLNQVGETEYPVNLAWFYLEHQVSNYLSEPWRYGKAGATIRLKVMDEYRLEDFPQLLRDRGFTYLWIYTTDKYLTKNLKQVFEMDTQVENGQLYKIEYGEGETEPRLTLVGELT